MSRLIPFRLCVCLCVCWVLSRLFNDEPAFFVVFVIFVFFFGAESSNDARVRQLLLRFSLPSAARKKGWWGDSVTYLSQVGSLRRNVSGGAIFLLRGADDILPEPKRLHRLVKPTVKAYLRAPTVN